MKKLFRFGVRIAYLRTQLDESFPKTEILTVFTKETDILKFYFVEKTQDPHKFLFDRTSMTQRHRKNCYEKGLRYKWHFTYISLNYQIFYFCFDHFLFIFVMIISTNRLVHEGVS